MNLSMFRHMLTKCFGSFCEIQFVKKWVENLRFQALKLFEAEYISAIVDWKFCQSRMFIAKYLQEFPFYVSDILCIRLRMSPKEHWLSRTAGSFKYLVQNFKSKKLTPKGFVVLLTY